MSNQVKGPLTHFLEFLRILKGQNPVHILGSGEQSRCYTYGGDLARGIISTLENVKAINNDYNLSTSKVTTVTELARIIWKQIYGTDENFAYKSEKPFEYDVQKRIPGTSKAKNDLGFEATVTLEEMLEEVIPWIQNAIEENLI